MLWWSQGGAEARTTRALEALAPDDAVPALDNADGARRWLATARHRVAAATTINEELTIITALVNAGANPDAGDQHGRAPLHWAARWTTDPTMMSTLVELGADPNNRDERARTPLHWAARWT